jgi:NADPH:quinone reductase-like Zn-dependent oxidoreductase
VTRAEAWFLYRGEGEEVGKPARLVRESFDLPPCGPDQMLAEPVYGCWEGNMDHGLTRKPIDICRHRGEDKVVVGNAGVVRIKEVGRDVRRFSPGQHAIVFPSSVVDRFGYPEKMLGYDAAGTMGCLATKLLIREHEVVPVPEGTRFALAQWAAFSVRYITAWANLELALGVLRLMVNEEECPMPHVWGWGGGTTFAELDLAKRRGCHPVMISGHEGRLRAIETAGIGALDRRQFQTLDFDEARFCTDVAYRRRYTQSETAFLSQVVEKTDGQGVHIFVDYMGSPFLRLTLKAIGRVGVVTTAGWKEGMVINFLRASECIERRQHVHTHYARYAQGLASVEYAERTGWMPHLDDPVTPFDDVQTLADRFHAGHTGFFPVYSVNPE